MYFDYFAFSSAFFGCLTAMLFVFLLVSIVLSVTIIFRRISQRKYKEFDK